MSTKQENIKSRISSSIMDNWPEFKERNLVSFCELIFLPSETLVRNRKMTLNKPYGHNHILKSNGSFGISLVQINPNNSTSLHYHKIRREFFLVRKGILSLENGLKVNDLTRNEFDYSVPYKGHSLKNNGIEICEVLEIFTPFLINDKFRIKDTYGRALGDVKYLE